MVLKLLWYSLNCHNQNNKLQTSYIIYTFSPKYPINYPPVTGGCFYVWVSYLSSQTRKLNNRIRKQIKSSRSVSPSSSQTSFHRISDYFREHFIFYFSSHKGKISENKRKNKLQVQSSILNLYKFLYSMYFEEEQNSKTQLGCKDNTLSKYLCVTTVFHWSKLTMWFMVFDGEQSTLHRTEKWSQLTQSWMISLILCKT